MTSLTFYGGINEIGGNKIMVETPNGSILLDFGRRMGITSEYYAEFLQIRSKNALRDMIRLELLPRIDNIYASHFVDTTSCFDDSTNIDKIPMDKAPDYWKLTDVSPYDPKAPGVDGVFITHAHFDHMQDVSFLDPAIPIYCTEETKIMAKAITDVSATKVDQQFYQLRRKEVIIEKSKGYKTLFPGALDFKEETEDPKPNIQDEKTGFCFTHEYSPRYRTFITTPEGKVKGIKYKIIPADHSLPGSCSVVLELSDGKRILYTGDIRFRGANGRSIDDYVRDVGNPIHYLITEGTRVDSTDVLTEGNISTEISSEIKNAEGLVLIDFGWKDISRFNIIYKAANKHNRTLVIQPKLAYLLYELHKKFQNSYEDPRTMPNLQVYLKREGSYLYSQADYKKFKMGYLHFHGRNKAKKDRNIVRIAEQLGKGGDEDNRNNPILNSADGTTCDYQEVYNLAIHHLENGIKAYEIREHPEKFVLMFSFWDVNELFDLTPKGDIDHKTKYIRASTAPFNDEMVIDETRFMKWLDTFNIEYDTENRDNNRIFTRKHISGHASQNELKELIQKINPERIIPIHTEHPEIFEQMFPGKVEIPKYGKPIDL